MATACMGSIKKLKEKGVAVEEELATSMFPDHPFKTAWAPSSEALGVWLELVDAGLARHSGSLGFWLNGSIRTRIISCQEP
jgi:hypothetical protein